MNYIEITVPCPECDGFGTVESQRPVGNSEGKDYYIVEIECDECFGSGMIPLKKEEEDGKQH